MQPFNKYFPPDFDPSKSNSVNQHLGVHPLGNRARKLKTEGILIVRFELPFNIWCNGCEKHLGMGVRYNAQKKKVGNYLSTPIWSFRMKCHLCPNWFEIQTDPKNTQYVVVQGARKKIEEYDPEDAQVLQLNDDSIRDKIASNPLAKLEHQVQDQRKGKEIEEELEVLKSERDALWEDDFSKNQLLRKRFRDVKKTHVAQEKEIKKIQDAIGTRMPILPPSSSDQIQASIALSEASEDILSLQLKKNRQGILKQSIFGSRKGKNTLKSGPYSGF